GVEEGIVAAAAVDHAVKAAAGLEGKLVVGRAADNVLEATQGEVAHGDGVDALDDIESGRVRPHQRVGTSAADERGDIAESAADAGGHVALQVDGDRAGEIGIIQGIA